MPNYIETHHSVEDEQVIHLRDYFLVLLKRKWLILSIMLLAILAAAVKSFTAVPYYTAYSQVLLERSKGNQGLDLQYYSYEPNFLGTQSEIIRSVNVGKRVVDNLGLSKKYKHYFIIDESQNSFLSSLKLLIKGLFKSVSDVLTSTEKIDGSSYAELELIAEPLSDEDIIARQISANLQVSPVSGTKIVTISYSDKNPAMAQMIANAAVKGYIDEVLEIKLSSSSYSLQWMTDKAQQEMEKLERAERALQKYMRDNDLVTVENRLTIYPQRLSDFGSQLSIAESERKEYEDLLAQIQVAGKDFDQLENIPVFADSKVLKGIREEIYKANQKIKELSKKYGRKHPLLIKAKDDVNVLKKEKQFEIQRIVDSTKHAYDLLLSKENNIKELLSETKGEVLNLNEKFIQYSILKREVDASRLVYETLQSNIKKESVTEQAQNVNIWVIKDADLPLSQSYPNKKRALLLGMLLGVFSGVGLAFIVEYLDNTVKSENELEKRYGKPVLGSVQKIDTKDVTIETYVLQQMLSPVAESYRLIRSGLLLSSAERPPKSILVTSMGQGEGKTSTAINIARIMALDNRKVLVIDCDMRRPRVHTLFDIENEKGLSSYLSGNIVEIVLDTVNDQNLSVITSGPIPPNPTELLSSQKMRELVEQMTEQFDFVLLDSPPVQSVTDALALSTIAEGTVVVVQYGKTTYDMLNSGMKKLTDVNAQTFGFVLNGFKYSKGSSYYSSGYSGYYADYAD